jgi:hypothetical protein
LSALKTAAIAALNAPGEDAHEIPAPRLFRIVVDGKEVSLVGNEANPKVIRITVPPKKAAK